MPTGTIPVTAKASPSPHPEIFTKVAAMPKSPPPTATGPIFEVINNFHDDLVAIRQDIHAHPELGFEENRTADIVAEKLTEWGIEVHRGLGKTGVVGTLRTGNDPNSIGLRADMDALPILEANTFAHRSTDDGKMHACGHDGHTTMLLGAARYLAETRNFEGCIHFIFQPAEEAIGGAKAMIADGLFDQFPCDTVFGMHNSPGLPAGQFAIRPGPMMAGGALFDIKVTGNGAHGARPESGIDPVVIGAQIISACQTIVSRNVPPQQTAVISFTQFHAGDAYNVIPGEAHIMGTTRAFSQKIMDMIEANMTATAQGIASAMGGKAEIDFRVEFLPTVNDPEQTTFAADCAAKLIGEANVNRNRERIMGSEDFSYMLNVRPGAYINIGNGDDDGFCQVHNPSYDFNDSVLSHGAAYFATLAETKLGVKTKPDGS
ncbi:M20 family metallopeptidase [Alphaproteobacteria bacterium]|nr:M20 family metallopeptidase [Alphaproteobacteria bacterium]